MLGLSSTSMYMHHVPSLLPSSECVQHLVGQRGVAVHEGDVRMTTREGAGKLAAEHAAAPVMATVLPVKSYMFCNFVKIHSAILQ